MNPALCGISKMHKRGWYCTRPRPHAGPCALMQRWWMRVLGSLVFAGVSIVAFGLLYLFAQWIIFGEIRVNG